MCVTSATPPCVAVQSGQLTVSVRSRLTGFDPFRSLAAWPANDRSAAKADDHGRVLQRQDSTQSSLWSAPPWRSAVRR